MPDIIQVVFQFLDRVLVALAVGIIYLRPPGDPRFDQVPKMIKRDGLLITFGALAPLRTRTNQADVAFEGIPKLRQLIKPKFPQPTPHGRYTTIAFSRVDVFARLIRSLTHRAELKKNKTSSVAPDSFLPKKTGLPSSLQISRGITTNSGAQMISAVAEATISKSRLR